MPNSITYQQMLAISVYSGNISLRCSAMWLRLCDSAIDIGDPLKPSRGILLSTYGAPASLRDFELFEVEDKISKCIHRTRRKVARPAKNSGAPTPSTPVRSKQASSGLTSVRSLQNSKNFEVQPFGHRGFQKSGEDSRQVGDELCG